MAGESCFMSYFNSLTRFSLFISMVSTNMEAKAITKIISK